MANKIIVIIGSIVFLFIFSGKQVAGSYGPSIEEQKLIIEDKVEKFSQDKLGDLYDTDYWSHTNSDGCDFSCKCFFFISIHHHIHRLPNHHSRKRLLRQIKININRI